MIPRLERLVRIDPTRLRALIVVLVAVLTFHGCAAAAGRSVWLVLVFAVLATLAVAIRTDGATESVLFVALGLDWWGASDGLSWWCLPAAVCLLVVHSAVTLVASGPDTAPVPRELVLRWVRRTALVAAGCTALGALLLGVRHAGLVTTWWVLPAALVVLAAVTVAFAESVRRD